MEDLVRSVELRIEGRFRGLGLQVWGSGPGAENGMARDIKR